MKFINFLISIRDYIGVTGIIILLTCFVGAFLAYYYNIKVSKWKFSYNDFKCLEKALTPAIHLLNEGKRNSYFIVCTEYEKHDTAMKAFPLPNKSLRSFKIKRNWKKYKNKCDEIKDYGKSIALGEKDEFPEDFMIAEDPEESKRDKDYKEDLSRLIKKLLKSANRF